MFDHKPLASTTLFWCALLAPLSVGGGLGLLIFFSTDLGGFCGESVCVRNFFDAFKFPLAIMGSSLPLVAMVAAVHRSKEAALQIAEVIKNNRFGNYLKHRETFEKLVDAFCARHGASIDTKVGVRSHRLYARLFPRSGYGVLEWAGEHDVECWEKVESKIKEIHEELRKSVGEFDLERYMGALQYLVGVLELDYPDFMIYEYRSPAGAIYKIHVEDSDEEISYLYYVFVDIISLVMVVRGFLGKNDFSDLLTDTNPDDAALLLSSRKKDLVLTRFKRSS